MWELTHNLKVSHEGEKKIYANTIRVKKSWFTSGNYEKSWVELPASQKKWKGGWSQGRKKFIKAAGGGVGKGGELVESLKTLVNPIFLTFNSSVLGSNWYIINWMLRQIFIFSINWNTQWAKLTLPHPLSWYWMN